MRLAYAIYVSSFGVPPAGLAVHGTTETLWRSVLQSRVAESVLVHVGEPFHAPDVRLTWSVQWSKSNESKAMRECNEWPLVSSSFSCLGLLFRRSLDVGLQRLPWHQYIALNKDPQKLTSFQMRYVVCKQDAMQDAIATGIEDADKNPSTV